LKHGVAILALLCVDAVVAFSQTAQVALAWDADTDRDVIGFRVSIDDAPEVMVGDAEFTAQLLKGWHRATVKAVDSRFVESLPAELIFEVREFTLTIQGSTDLAKWSDLFTHTFLSAAPQMFFRLEITSP
jgi:hypothetical protein